MAVRGTIGILATAVIMGFIGMTFFTQKTVVAPQMVDIQSLHDIVELFPRSVEEIKDRSLAAEHELKSIVSSVIAVPDEKRSFENTMRPLDRIAVSQCLVFCNVFEVLELVSPDAEIRAACHEALIAFKTLWIELMEADEALYKAVLSYSRNQADQEKLTTEERYVMDQWIADWQRNGLNLPQTEREKIVALKRELTTLSVDFDRNIAADATVLEVEKDELQGLDDDFINSLARTESGKCILPLDYPTRDVVMSRCEISATREKMYRAMNNRAYPINKPILEEIIRKRAELAQALGYKNFAELDLDNQMVKTPERAHEFLLNLRSKGMVKAEAEFKELVSDLPHGVTLVNGKMNPWDSAYVRYIYKQKHFDIDEFKLAEYFPMDHTIKQLFAIYEAFFGLEFIRFDAVGLWHKDVIVLQVNDAQTKKKLGYLVLDLHPRPNKFTHACMAPIVRATYRADGTYNGAIAIVIANFSKPTESKPSLLRRSEVTTFFHEFGHAIHELLGRTDMASAAGTQVKMDFVEMPSQQLEPWMLEREILKMVSHHYQTGQSLSDDVIDKLVELKKFSTGSFITGQLIFSELALAYFEAADVNVDAVLQKLSKEIAVHTLLDPQDHMYAAFGHLTGYGPKYYGYLWSNVFAQDLFNEIKKEGLLNRTVGKRYVDAILSKGGSADPNELLFNFLGRAPSEDAFIENMGL